MTYSFNPDLRARIERHLAAHEVQRLHAPEARHAAVGVVLLADEAGQACFVLTRRVATLRRHSGQWALPGGRLEPGETPQAAALREIHEEIGLALDASAVIGPLDDFLSRSGHLISPIVAWSPMSEITANAEEVHAAYIVPLEALDAPDAVSFAPLLHFNLPILGTVFAPTAALVYQFREVALHGRPVRVHDTEQPYFAWR